MFSTCEACGKTETWHPQVHISANHSPGCVDEDLVPLVLAACELEIAVLGGCQDNLQSGRVRLRFKGAEDARALLDEVVRSAPEQLRRRILEAGCPPVVDAREWAVDVDIRASAGPAHRVLGLPLSVAFPRDDLPLVARCLSGECAAVTAAAPVDADSEEAVSAVAILRGLVQSTIAYANEDAYMLLDLDQADDELLEELVGEAWNAPSPGFYPELPVERPQFMTWLALRATAKALHAPDTEWGDADLDDHLAAVELAERWCATSYARLTGEDIEEVVTDGPAIHVGVMERWPKPTFTIWRVAHSLSQVTASPYEIDPQEVRSLLVEGLTEIRNHADELKLLASYAHYPAGDPRWSAPEIPDVTPPPTPDGVKHFDRSLTVDLDNYTDDGTVRMHFHGGERDVPYSNLRHLMNVAHQVCELPAGVSYACAVRYDVAGRPARITFVRCLDRWQEIAASELQVGDRLYEDIDYPYVVSQVITSYDDDQVVVQRSGRGWLTLKLATPVRAQRG